MSIIEPYTRRATSRPIVRSSAVSLDERANIKLSQHIPSHHYQPTLFVSPSFSQS
jgi:hypothetical protein